MLIDIEKPKTKPDDSKRGAEVLAEFLKDTPRAEFAVWTNGTERLVYGQVREQYPELFGAKIDRMELDPPTVSYVVAQLDRFDFLHSSVDVKGEAYEAIVGKNLQGTRGEFFTPRNAVKMGIRMLDPEPGMKCIDPACGTGGFIVVILNCMAERIRRQRGSQGRHVRPRCHEPSLRHQDQDRVRAHLEPV
jgi:type I restriction-modification system DNA methylase subunit